MAHVLKVEFHGFRLGQQFKGISTYPISHRVEAPLWITGDGTLRPEPRGEVIHGCGAFLFRHRAEKDFLCAEDCIEKHISRYRIRFGACIVVDGRSSARPLRRLPRSRNWVRLEASLRL